jgi:hypothetical protein
VKKLFILAAVFSFGYVGNDVVNSRLNLVPVAEADIMGMGYRELSRDRDFKKAVQRVVSGNCYVDLDSIYC